MRSQSGMFEKVGVGFDFSKKQMLFENIFIQKGKEVVKRSKCSYCNKYRHVEFVLFS